MLFSGVRAQIAIRIVGDDLDVLLRGEGAAKAAGRHPRAWADLELEKQVLAPQIRVPRLCTGRAVRRVAGDPLRQLQTLIDGEQLGQVIEGARRFALVLRLPEEARGLERAGQPDDRNAEWRVPLSRVATIEDGDGPNQISRDNGRRRIVISANARAAPSDVVADVRRVISETKLSTGYFITPRRAVPRTGGSGTHHRPAGADLAQADLHRALQPLPLGHPRALVIANVPLAMIGSVIGLWLSGQPLSIATLIGFITLAGIATRNGILKLSHYANLVRFEGERFGRQLVIRGSLER